jgi:hypothetical protein
MTTTTRTPRTITADPMFYRFALGALRAIRRRDADWQVEAESYRRDGYRPRHCKHGTSMWHDYDVMCPGCEDSLTPHEEALVMAHNDMARADKVIALMAPILTAQGGATPPAYVTDALTRWVLEQMPDAVYPN